MGTTVIATGAGVVAASAPTAEAAAAAPLKLVAAAKSITLAHAHAQPVWFEPAVHVVAGEQPFEIWARRSSYAAPILARRAHTVSGGKQMEVLPGGLVTSYTGLLGFTHITVKDRAGRTVLERDDDFCPNGGAVRSHPDAPASSPYPEGCSGNPFTLGAVWGIQRGWGVPASSPWWQREPVNLADGEYTAEVRINARYAHVFGVPARDASVSVAVVVRTVAGEPPLETRRSHQREMAAKHQGTSGRPIHAAVPRPADASRVPKAHRPDLRALPAWDIRINDDDGSRDRDHLSFNATIWTAGTSPLVVEGFRRKGEAAMDAYQYFYDVRGEHVGQAHVGTMDWDDREGQQHWGFTAFAAYRLLDAHHKPLTSIAADASCLADTDAIDYTITLAHWRPWTAEPHSFCGDWTSIATRAVLNIGSGFTDTRFMPGQTFDITDRPNGTYYLQVLANPRGHLLEADTTNNASQRKIVLGGRPGARTVDVPPHQAVTG